MGSYFLLQSSCVLWTTFNHVIQKQPHSTINVAKSKNGRYSFEDFRMKPIIQTGTKTELHVGQVLYIFLICVYIKEIMIENFLTYLRFYVE